MIKKYLVKFTFVISVMFVGVFVSGCGGDIERSDAEKQVIKNANNITIMKNMDIGTFAFMEKFVSKSQGILIRLKYNGESCVSLGFSSIVSSKTLSDDMFDATVTIYVDDDRSCELMDFGYGKNSGNKGMFLVGNK